MNRLVCRSCGATFLHRDPSREYCSELCLDRDRARRLSTKVKSERQLKEEERENRKRASELASARAVGETRNCTLCGKEFVPEPPVTMFFCCPEHQRHALVGGAQDMRTIRE